MYTISIMPCNFTFLTFSSLLYRFASNIMLKFLRGVSAIVAKIWVLPFFFQGRMSDFVYFFSEISNVHVKSFLYSLESSQKTFFV